jgi:hypothetical protein
MCLRPGVERGRKMPRHPLLAQARFQYADDDENLLTDEVLDVLGDEYSILTRCDGGNLGIGSSVDTPMSYVNRVMTALFEGLAGCRWEHLVDQKPHL